MEKERDGRSDPELLLGWNFPGDNNRGRGRLKIFFGYVAGTGKTLAMLEAARQEKTGGRDMVVDYIEPHDRLGTLALSGGLELLTLKYVEYKGIILREFGLGGVLIRHSDLVLMGELTHTNTQGCRHKKRYQDVTELLDAGISVYTTVNIQHLKSLHDITASIIHVRVNERIPDRIFGNAAQAELVDIGPEELRQRLEERKICHRGRIDRASISFFTAQNPSALHEIALRRMVDRVSREMIRGRDVAGKDYFTGEHVLVYLLPLPTNAKAVRAATRVASVFHVDFTTVLVETEHLKEEHVRISRSTGANINLAKQLRADVITLYGDDIVEQVVSYVRQDGISKIAIGRAVRARRSILAESTLVDHLIRAVPSMDTYMTLDASTRGRKRNGGAEQKRRVGSGLLKAALIMALCTVISLILDHYQLGVINATMIYMMGTILPAYLTRVGWCGLLTSVAPVLLFNFFFTESHYTLQADASIYLFTFAAMLIYVLVTGFMASGLKWKAVRGEAESRYMRILSDVSRNLRKGSIREKILDVCETLVRNLLKRNIMIHDTREGRTDRMEIYPASENEGSTRFTSLSGQQGGAAVAF